MSTFKSTVAGIPCLIEVIYFDYQPHSHKSPLQCETPFEYYGYLDVEFNVLDRRGRLAKWLEAKLTDDDIDRINHEALEVYRGSQYY
jgi:hypothetical protein